MKVLLIFPPLNRMRDLSITTCMPPLGIATLAAVLEETGFYNINLMDGNLLSRERMFWECLPQALKQMKPKVVGITCTTPSVINVLKISRIIKSVNPDTFIIIGGPHASVMPEELLKLDSSIDFVVVGEGEITIKELLNCIREGSEWKRIKGIAYRDNGRIIVTEKRPLIEDLNMLPFPARHLLSPLTKYKFARHCYKNLPVTSMITSRGCFNECRFCTQGVFQRRYRARSAESVVSEIRILIEKYGIKSIMIVDDTFTADKKRIQDICGLIRNKSLNISWLCYANIQDIDRNLLKEMKKAGCYQIYYGIESGVQRLLNIINKRVTIEQIKAAVRYAKEAGLEVRGQFMLGIPTETRREIEKTIEFAKRLDLEYAEFGFFTPLPGSQLYEEAVSSGKFRLIDTSDFEIFREGTSCFISPIVNLTQVSTEDLMSLMKSAYRNFYLRLGYMIKRISKIKSLKNLKKELQALYAVTFGLSRFYRNINRINILAKRRS